MWFCYDSLFFLVVKITTNGWKKCCQTKAKPYGYRFLFCFLNSILENMFDQVVIFFGFCDFSFYPFLKPPNVSFF